MATVRNSNTDDDFEAAIEALSSADKARVRLIAIGLAFCCGMDGEDLFQEAICRTLAGSRTWPSDVPLVAYLAMTMKSIASGERLKEGRRPFGSDKTGVEDPDGSIPDNRIQNPEEAALQKEFETKFYGLFDDDPDAQMIALGMVEGLEGEQLRETVGLDSTAFASKRRKVRRKINRAYMLGSDND